MVDVRYKTDLDQVDWKEMKTTLSQDQFDNERSPEQLKASFENSYATCITYSGSRIVGTPALYLMVSVMLILLMSGRSALSVIKG